MQFGKEIIRWYEANKRDLPWRRTRDPYFIWLSEIILQQTRVDQGFPYYNRFAGKYPDVKSLAAAKEDDILKMWQGLGYYSRARNLHHAARQIVNDYNGKFPHDYSSILSLKGVGEYTAAAIASFAFDQNYPVVDGNVFRLLSRYFGIKTPIDTSQGKKKFTALAGELLTGFPPAIFNQAIMEFGAGQCRPVNPDCRECPLRIGCYAAKHKMVSSFPIKKSKAKIRKRYFHYLVVRNNHSFYIRKRNEKDIWQGLHDFPLIETDKKISEIVLMSSDDWKKTFNRKKITLLRVSREYKHLLSHQHIHARFYEILSGEKHELKLKNDWKKVNRNSVKKFAIPKLIENYLEGREGE